MALTTTNNASNSRISTVNISSAELLNLLNNPITIASAPGANSVIVPTKFVMSNHFNTTAYVGGNIDIVYQGLSNRIVVFDGNLTTGLISNTEIATLDGNYLLENSVNLINKAIILQKSSGNLTSGNGTLTIVCYYDIVPVTV